MVGNLCTGVDAPETFGEFSLQPGKFKCYMGDTGLLMTMAAGKNYLNSDLYKSFMKGKLAINKGMMTENLVAQMLRAGGYSLRLYEKIVEEEGEKHKYEVDFLLYGERKTTPIEVKSGSNKSHPSMDFFCDRYKNRTDKGVFLTKGDLRQSEDYPFLPLPMAMFL